VHQKIVRGFYFVNSFSAVWFMRRRIRAGTCEAMADCITEAICLAVADRL